MPSAWCRYFSNQSRGNGVMRFRMPPSSVPSLDTKTSLRRLPRHHFADWTTGKKKNSCRTASQTPGLHYSLLVYELVIDNRCDAGVFQFHRCGTIHELELQLLQQCSCSTAVGFFSNEWWLKLCSALTLSLRRFLSLRKCSLHELWRHLCRWGQLKSVDVVMMHRWV